MAPTSLHRSQFAPWRSHSGSAKPGLSTAEQIQHQAVVRQTEKWVAGSFYGTLLKQMHDSPFKSKMLDGGRGGEAFSGLLDQHLADRMSHGSAHKLVKSIVHHIEKSKAAAQYARQTGGAQTSQAVTPAPATAHDGNPHLGGRHHRRMNANIARNARIYVAPTH